MANNSPIGIFDSGIGGLTVFAAIKRHLPNESIVYLGDTARVPYGTKSDETVVKYSLQNAEFLKDKGVKAIVVACNTASALAIPALKERMKLPVIGMVGPGAKAALNASRKRRIGVIGTQGTISSNAYGSIIHHFDQSVDVKSCACSLFVPLVEEGWLAGDIPQAIAEQYLGGLKKEDIDVLILGCTHYPLLKAVISRVMGDKVALVDSGEAAAESLGQLLDERGLNADEGFKGEDHIFVTDVPRKFKEVASQFLGGDLPNVTMVNF